jgi:alpha-L-rhamnosidase
MFPGYKHVLIRPQPGGGATRARASHESMYGRVASGWQIADGVFSLTIEIPCNTRASVRLPRATLDKVSESGKGLAAEAGVRSHQDGDAVVVEVGSGRYVFTYPWKSGN